METEDSSRAFNERKKRRVPVEEHPMSQSLTAHRFSRRRAIGVLAGSGLSMPFGRRALADPIEPKSGTTTEPAVESKYFPQSGHNLDGPFLRAWNDAGGEEVLGFPLSEDRFAEGTGIVQTFQTVTLVYDPSLDAPWDLQSQHLPDSVRSGLAPVAARQKVAGCPVGHSSCQFFDQSGHTISGRIAAFWQAHGDLPIFGMPTTEPFEQSGAGITLQVFERAVLEDHGEQKGVNVRQVAADLAEADSLFSDPAFVPAPPSGGATQLVKAEEGLRLRGLPSTNAEIIAVLPDNAEFIAAPNESGNWIGGYTDGYSGWVSADYLKAPPALPKISVKDWDPSIWQGAALGETNIRRQPTTKSDVVDVLQYGDDLTVKAWVKGEEVFTGADLWAQVDDEKFVYGRNVGRNAPVEAPPLPSDAPSIGRWIDVHLTQQLMTAYEDRNVVRVTVTTTGMAGYETPTGFYNILTRVPNETMESGAIGAEHYYKLEDVLFTQYFTNLGHAIHFAWWRTPETIGRPGSHGCLNLLLDDSQFYWNWATFGTPVYVHY
jgi:hypothetical protein